MSLEGRVALVTAGTGGIGIHVARRLAEHGARVIVTGRDAVRGQDAIASISAGLPKARVELVLSDASSVAANIGLATEVERRFDRLDVLVNNAGVMRSTHTVTSEGLEITLATNFVGAFALTTRLLPLLRESSGERLPDVARRSLRRVTPSRALRRD
jgi:NAD(P)-dependent dehydrogenase (short-subunit alcohol dehydrogenase family)